MSSKNLHVVGVVLTYFKTKIDGFYLFYNDGDFWYEQNRRWFCGELKKALSAVGIESQKFTSSRSAGDFEIKMNGFYLFWNNNGCTFLARNWAI